MATAVTLKESDGTEIYPVTDISLVNNGIHADTIDVATPVPPVETAMIADGAVTNAKIDWSTVTSTAVSVSDFVTASTGYTITGGINKTGNLLIANLVVTQTSGSFVSGQVIVGNIKTGHRPKTGVNFVAGLGASEWSVKGACYCFINSGGDIYVNNQTGITGCPTVKILGVWFTA